MRNITDVTEHQAHTHQEKSEVNGDPSSDETDQSPMAKKGGRLQQGGLTLVLFFSLYHTNFGQKDIKYCPTTDMVTASLQSSKFNI